MKRLALFLLIIFLIPFQLFGCAMFDDFRKPLTVVALTLLQELERLLLEYEAAEPANPADPIEILAFEGKQMQRHRAIASLIAQASTEVPAKDMQPYRDRLRAVPRGSPSLH